MSSRWRKKSPTFTSVRQAAEALMRRLEPAFAPQRKSIPDCSTRPTASATSLDDISSIPLPLKSAATQMVSSTNGDEEVQIIENRPAAGTVSGTGTTEHCVSSQLSTDFFPLSDFPPFEAFDSGISASSAQIKFESDARVGDLLWVRVKKCDAAGAYVKPLCFESRIKRDLEWLNIQLLTSLSSLERRVSLGEYLLAKIVATNPVRIKLQLQAASPLMTDRELPKYFREARELGTSTEGSSSTATPEFWTYIESRPDTHNPYLETRLGMPEKSPFSFLKLKGLEKDRTETASVLRKKQDSELAMQSVVKGVEAMKSGNRLGALQHFNHALTIDEKCVDALVARGAAYSNDGHFEKAEEDFDKALSIQPDHPNAKIYMIETLISHANLIEIKDENELARKKYEKVLRIKEDRRARQGLEKIRNKKRRASPGESREAKRRRDEEIERERRERQREEQKARKMKQEDKKKLAEMEDFIRALKNGKK